MSYKIYKKRKWRLAMSDKKNTLLSVEVFPPKKDDEFEGVYAVLDQLKLLEPEFISVTYGAGGSRSKKTVEIASYIQNTLGIKAIAHMTCVGNKREDIARVAGELKEAGVCNILALRGDRPSYMTDEQFEGRDFTYASQLVGYVKSIAPQMHVAGACYPEKHYEAASMDEDLDNLLLKVNAGCESLISQLFMDNDKFYSFLELARKKGITVPIHAGVMPITSMKQVDTSISLSGTSIPREYSGIIEKYSTNAEDFRKASVDFAIRQIIDLVEHGVDGVHIYSMNKPKLTKQIMDAVKGQA
jgi:methylenetetrahydrofolate reductase (NADPH)